MSAFFTTPANSACKTWKRMMPKKKRGRIGSHTLKEKTNKLSPSPLNGSHHVNYQTNDNLPCSISRSKQTPKQLQRHINTHEQTLSKQMTNISALTDCVSQLEELVDVLEHNLTTRMMK